MKILIETLRLTFLISIYQIKSFFFGPGCNDFCVSQCPITLLDMTTEDKYVFNTHIYSSLEFLFHLLYSCFMKVLNFRSNILAGKFPVSSLFETLLYSCSAHVPIFPCLSAPRKHTKHRFDLLERLPRTRKVSQLKFVYFIFASEAS